MNVQTRRRGIYARWILRERLSGNGWWMLWGRSGALAGMSSFLISKILPSRRVAKVRGQRYHLAGVRRCARHTLRDELIVRRDVDTLKIFIPDYAPASLTILHVRIQKRQNQSAITVRSDLPSREKSARSSRAHAAPATPSRRPILAPCEFCAFRSDSPS